MLGKLVLKLALRVALPRLRTFYDELHQMESRSGYIRVRVDTLMFDVLMSLNGGLDDLKAIMGDKAAEVWARMCGEETIV